MCQGKQKIWIKFNPIFFGSIIFFVFTLILAIIKFIFNFFPKIQEKINGDAFDDAVNSLLTISTLIFGFYWANYKVRKNNRINNIENYIQDFTSSHKLIKNILGNFEYIKFDSLIEIRAIVEKIDKYFGLHYFNIFIGNSKLTSIYISEQVGNFMVDINKNMKKIEKIISEIKFKFGVQEERLIQIINNYIKNMIKKSKNEKKHMIEFGESIKALLPEDKSTRFYVLFSIWELLGSIDAFLRKNYINAVIEKLMNINKSFWNKSDTLKKAINNCKRHSKTTVAKNNFCLSSQNLIITECINKSW